MRITKDANNKVHIFNNYGEDMSIQPNPFYLDFLPADIVIFNAIDFDVKPLLISGLLTETDYPQITVHNHRYPTYQVKKL